MSVSQNIEILEAALEEFKTEHAKYEERGINSAGSKARKALMTVKKTANVLRKEILDDQKEKKAAKKATKEEE